MEKIPKSIYTTDLDGPAKFPEQFKSWTEKNVDWQVYYVSDEAMDEWLIKMFGEGSGVVKEMMWLKKRGVVRADLFR
jgi:mannosyltransferase OCH1-like enzyme